MALRKHYFDMETAQVPESRLVTPADSFSIDIDGKASIEKWLEISVSNRRPPSRRNSSSDMYVEIKKPPKKTLSEPSLSKLLIQKMRPQHRRERKERKAIMRRLRAYSHPERWYLRAAFILSLINGALLPLYALVFSHTLETIMGFEEPHYSSELRFLALMFLMFAVVTFVSYGLSLSFFSVVAEHMTTRIRSEVYEKMLRMHIAWHDDPKHNPGALSSKLATDATAVTTLTSTGVGAMLQMTSSFIISTVLSFIGSWKLALIALGLSPLMIITGELNIHFAAKFSEKNDEAFKEAGAIMIEALNNMRTVISLGREKEILAMYSKVLEKPEKMAIKRGLISGFLLGISEVIMFVIVGIIYFLGAVFIKVYGDGLEGIFHTTFETMYGFLSIETVMPLVPDAARAINSAKSLFKILDTNSEIDYKNPDEKSLQPIEGKIEFRRVSFRYPNQEKQLFSDLSFKIPKGAKIALVGASGCGKTTIMQLLLRYYDVEKGEILLDGKNIKEYDIHHLRNHFGYVSQEPVIFNGTIEENIKYNLENANEDEVIQAAKDADAYEFITHNAFEVTNTHEHIATHDHIRLGCGFKRKVGAKGSQLSCGQKQRIAIARALMRKPKIFLLDEATSALDSTTEKQVQVAVDRVTEKYTVVNAVHRISIAKNFTEIFVFKDGKIVEKGTYRDLTKAKGVFYKLERGIHEDIE